MNKRSRRWWLLLRMFSGWFEFEVRAALILSRSAAFGGVTCRERPVAWRAECDYVVTGWERTDGAPSSGRFARCCACAVSSPTRYQRRPDSKRRISFIPSHSNVLGIEHCAGSILCGSSCSVPHSHRHMVAAMARTPVTRIRVIGLFERLLDVRVLSFAGPFSSHVTC